MVDRYKNKVIILSSFCGALLAAYILTFVFAPENSAARKALWTPLDPKLKELARQIELDGDEKTLLVEKNGRWFVSFEDALYPALDDKVLDMLDTLSTRGSYEVRSRSESAQEKLSLSDSGARRIVVSGEAGNTLLTLLVGAPDATQRYVYVRLADKNEIRSGEDVFSSFFTGRQSWYNLNLFPDRDADGLTVNSVQRLTIKPAETALDADDVFPIEAYTLARSGSGWIIEDTGEDADTQGVESYIRGIISCRANDFTPALGANDGEFNNPGAGRLVLETGDGTRRIVTIGPRIADKYSAAVSGSQYVYLLMDWQLEQLFKDSSSLVKK
jgi:hypothetical protein